MSVSSNLTVNQLFQSRRVDAGDLKWQPCNHSRGYVYIFNIAQIPHGSLSHYPEAISSSNLYLWSIDAGKHRGRLRASQLV